jgi:TolA-binding protein
MRHSALAAAGLLVALALVAAPGAVDAQAKKPGEPAKGAKPAAGAEKSGAPAAPAAPAAGEARPQGPADFKVPGRKDTVSRDALADKKRDEAIEQLKKLIPTFPDGPQKADLLFQLAELYWEKSKFIYAQEMDDFDQEWTKYLAAIDSGREAKKPKPNNRKSEIFKSQAIQVYERILKDYPEYPRNDEVLFILAQNKYEVGKSKNDKNVLTEAVGLYWELIKRYPKSTYVPDSYVQMGEHYFETNQLSKAVTSFGKALEFKDSQVYGFALYKLAWCDYNLGQYEDAINKFQRVVGYSEAQAQNVTENRSLLQLKEEALRDMVLAYSQVDAVEEAQDYFEKVAGRDKARGLFARLAATYVAQGKNEMSIRSFRLLINGSPNAEDAPGWQNEIVQGYFRIGDQPRVLNEMRRLVELYGPNSPWAKVNAEKKAALSRAYELTETAMRELVTNYHHEAQKTRRDETYATAQQIYAEYLRHFPESEHSYRLRFFYAEILFLREFYREAAEQYLKVVQSDEKAEYSVRSAYSQILAYEKIVAGHKREERAKDAKLDETRSKGTVATERFDPDAWIKQIREDSAQKPIPEPEQRLIEACDLYCRIAPEAKEFLNIKFKAAWTYFKYRHFESSAERYGEIIGRWPTTVVAQRAARTIITVFEIKEDWPNLNRWARTYRKNKELVSTKQFAGDLDKIIEIASYKEIQGIEAGGQAAEKAGRAPEAAAVFDDVATRFVAYQEEFPSSEFSDKALYNATVIYNKAFKVDRAIFTAERFLARYPKANADLKADITLYLGNFYERIADFDRAGDYFARFGKEFPKHARLCDAVYSAGAFYDGMGRSKEAIAQYEEFGKSCATLDDAPDVFLRIGLIHERDKDYVKANKVFDEFVTKHGSHKSVTAAKVFDARFRAAMGLREMGRHQDVDKAYVAFVRDWSKLDKAAQESPAVRKAVATAAFALTEPDFEKYRNVKLVLPQAKMKNLLAEKMAQAYMLVGDTNLRDLAKNLGARTRDEPGRYVQIVAYGDGNHAIAALFRIGQVYQGLAQALFDAPVPPNLDPDQQEIYTAELQNIAFPLEEKAIDAFEKATVKAYELSIYNDWVVKAQEQMAVYRPGIYPDRQEMPFYLTDFFLRSPRALAPAAAPAQLATSPAPAPAAAAPKAATAAAAPAKAAPASPEDEADEDTGEDEEY